MTAHDFKLSSSIAKNLSKKIGIAKLTTVAFGGGDLMPFWNDLQAQYLRHRDDAGALMDMSVIAQLLGDRDSGLVLQSAALKIERLFRTISAEPRLRVLAFVADIEMGGNTPIEFLLEDSDVELYTLYVVPGMPLPNPLPEHDVAFVAVPNLDKTRPTLDEIDKWRPAWPRPVLNRPHGINKLNRARLHDLLKTVPGLYIPVTSKISRSRLASIGAGQTPLEDSLNDGTYPLVVRPIDSHAGRGLAKLDDRSAIQAYLDERPESEFFISRFVDYRDTDGQFRKYRIVMIDGRPYACHMAIANEWSIWYLNADMALSDEKRKEEEFFMVSFDDVFAKRHIVALSEMANLIGLEYFAIDCAVTRDGKLLVFECDNAMLVHNMDSPKVYPYKSPQMRKLFDAFLAMMYSYAEKPMKNAAQA